MKWYNSDIAFGIFVFLTCLGIGTCTMLTKVEIKIHKVEEIENKN